MRDRSRCAVLVIDDDLAVADEICDVLRLRQYQPFHAFDLKGAREILAAHNDIFVVVCDYHMPKMNGIEVVEALGRTVPHPLAVVMLTGDRTQAVAVDSIRAKVFDFLNKPVEPKVLVDTVRRALSEVVATAEKEFRRSRLESDMERLAQNLAAMSQRLSSREQTLRRVLLWETSGVDSVVEEIRAPLRKILDRLRDLRLSLEESAVDGPDLLEEILREGRTLHDVVDGILLPPDDGPLTFEPVDLALVFSRLSPTLERLAARRGVALKIRLAGRAPFLCADETKVGRALTSLSNALIGVLSDGDGLAITSLREGNEIVLTYKVTSETVGPESIAALSRDLSQTLRDVERIGKDTLKLTEARIILSLHKGRIQIDRSSGSLWFVRLFLPLTEASDAPARANDRFH